MKKSSVIIIALFMISIFIVGCNDKENKNNLDNEELNQESNDNQENNQKAEEKKEEENENKSEVDYDTEVTLQGKMTYEDNVLTVEGETNLPEEASLTIAPSATDDDMVFVGVISYAKIDSDGSFYEELSIPQEYEGNLLVTLRFQPGETDDDFIHDLYGEKGEDFEGPFVRLYERIDEVKKGIETEILLTLDDKGRAEAEITEPEWDIPDDLGDYEIRMDARAEVKEDFIEVHGESNLIEGSQISFYLYDSEGFLKSGGGYTNVLPDGSFFRIIDPFEDIENLDQYELEISFKPSQYEWENVVEHYGEDESQLKGDLIEDDKASITIPLE